MRVRAPIAVALIAIAAFILRAGYVLVQTRSAIFDVQFVAADSNLYLGLGRSLADGHGMTLQGLPTAYVGPGYPLFLALLLRAGADATAIGIVQAFLGACTALVACATARELAVDRPPSERSVLGVLAAGAVAVYPHLIFWTGYVLTETLFVFWVGLAVLLTVRAFRLRDARLAVAAGAASALACLTRSPYLAVALVLLAWWWLASWRARDPRRAVGALAFALALAMPIGLWALRNMIDLGSPVVTSTESGFVFYQGNARGATGGSGGYVDERDFPPLKAAPGLSEPARDGLYFRTALTDVLADPAGAVARWPAKVVNMWRPTYAGASLRNMLVTFASYIPTLIAGTLGTILLLRRGLLRPTAAPAIFLAVWFASHVVVTGMIRFRLAGELVLLTAAPFSVLAVRDAWIRAPRIRPRLVLRMPFRQRATH